MQHNYSIKMYKFYPKQIVSHLTTHSPNSDEILTGVFVFRLIICHIDARHETIKFFALEILWEILVCVLAKTQDKMMDHSLVAQLYDWFQLETKIIVRPMYSYRNKQIYYHITHTTQSKYNHNYDSEQCYHTCHENYRRPIAF